MLPKGTILGHYRLLQRIGVGGMGEVYLAEDTRLPRQVAVKVVRVEADPYPNSAVVQDAFRLFQREMRAIASLDHRNILNLIDFGEETIEGMPTTYMIMPYRKEGSLNDWLQRYKTQGLLSLDDIDYILTQAAAALQHAHDHQIIHQDVKPPNFLIRENPGNPGRPDLLLTDFGVAKLTNATATASQHVRGTPAYMAPEQWESQPVPATDQYALAVMAYLFLAGRLPFEGRMEQVMRQHLMVAPQPPSAYNPQLSPAIDAIILRALAKKPEDRFPSIEDFARAFHQAIQYAGDLRTTLTISADEATTGGERLLTLPGGRTVSITVPHNAEDGQELRVENQGDAYYEGGTRGSLFLKIALAPEEAAPVSKPDNAHVPSTDAFPLEPATPTPQKQSDLLPPPVTVPPTPPVEPQTEPTLAQTSSPPVEPTTKPTASRTTPTTREKTDNEKWVMSPLSPVGSTSSLPPSSSLPERRTRRPLVIIVSLVAIFVLVVAGIAGIVHQASVNAMNTNATATAGTDATNSNSTNTAHQTAVAQEGTGQFGNPVDMTTKKAITINIVQSSTTTTCSPACYQYPNVKVKVGTTITWVNQSQQIQTVTAIEGTDPSNERPAPQIFDSGLSYPIATGGGTFSYTVTMAAYNFNPNHTVLYICELHPSMIAELTIVP